MTEEFYDPLQDVSELKKRLKEIRIALKPLIVDGRICAGEVPSEIREEIVKIYDEHGGINLLVKITHLGYNSIRNWHRTWQTDPLVFRRPVKRQKEKGSQVEKVVKKVLGANKSETPLKDMKVRHIVTENSTPAEKMTNELTLEEEAQIKKIKDLMKAKLSTGKGLDDEVKQEVAKLYETIGEVKSVAILLGLSERMVSSWIEPAK